MRELLPNQRWTRITNGCRSPALSPMWFHRRSQLPYLSIVFRLAVSMGVPRQWSKDRLTKDLAVSIRRRQRIDSDNRPGSHHTISTPAQGRREIRGWYRERVEGIARSQQPLAHGRRSMEARHHYLNWRLLCGKGCEQHVQPPFEPFLCWGWDDLESVSKSQMMVSAG